jgi:hypothetical protein
MRFTAARWGGAAARYAFWLALLTIPLLLDAGAAHAGPGGIVKAAARSPFGKVVIGLLVLIFLPIILYYSVKGALQVRKTRRDLAALAGAGLPQYRWLDVKDRVTESFTWMWSAWSRQKLDLVTKYATPWYWSNQQLQLDEWESKGLENVCQLKRIERITPIFVEHRPESEGSRLVVDIRARVIDYMVDKATGRVVQGDKNEGDLDTVWTFKWEDGAWRLNLIEAGSTEFAYLFEPNVVPDTHPGVAEPTGRS